jgi:hypothetical protein
MPSTKNEVTDFCREGGPQIGDILFWDGTEWVCLPAGEDGQILVVSATSEPEWQTYSG